MKGIAGPKKPSWTRETCIAGSALLALLAAQWMLSSTIRGTNYYGGDGKMVQAIALVAIKFGGRFDVTNLSPVAGIGSQLLPKNVWGNPALWPFHFLDKEVATDISALTALGIFALGCYLMTRCFDMSIVPSALAAQLCIGLFAPALLLVYTPTNFCLTPGDAVVYAPYMIALGLLARLELGVSRGFFAAVTTAICVLIFYSVYSDPLWATVAAFGWSVPFAAVTFGVPRLRAVLVRLAALVCCFGLLLASGVIIYLYTLSQYTARVHFAAALDRAHTAAYISAMTYSPNMKYFYVTWIVAWILGLFCLRGRSKMLVIASIVGFGVYLIYAVTYLVLNTSWAAPIPIYVEHCLFPLYLSAAVAGLWGALTRMAALADRLAWKMLKRMRPIPDDSPLSWPDLLGFGAARPSSRLRLASVAFAVVILSAVPTYTMYYALTDARSKARMFYEPWPDEPEAVQFFSQNIGLDVDTPFNGWVHFYTFNIDTGFTGYLLWTRGVGTIAEYSQLVAPQGVYFIHKLFRQDITNSLNGFVPFPGTSGDRFWKALQMFGTRYYVVDDASNEFARKHRKLAEATGLTMVVLPHRSRLKEGTGHWYIFELPHPNLGGYSPTNTILAESGDDVMAKLNEPGFDFTSQAVVSARVPERLVSAYEMRLTRTRHGLHLAGRSNGTSLVVLPQQFTNCLRPQDGRVRVVRTNLMMAGVVFSGDIDTDILFDYGMFSPWCRLADLKEIKELDLRIDLRMPHLAGGRLFPDWPEAVAKLKAAVNTVR